jgi:hypothetical protein
VSQQQGPADPIVEPDEGGDGAGGRRNRWNRVALWCALAGVTVAVVAVVALREPARSPAEELGRIREFVASAGTGRFEGTSRSEWGEGPDEPGSTSIDVSRLEGSFHLPERMRFLEDDGDFLYESIVVDDAAYSRSAESRAELEAEPWAYEKVPGERPGWSGAVVSEGIDEAGAAALSTASDVFSAFGAPFDLSELLGRLGGVRRVSSGVLEASLTARDLFPPEVVEAIEWDRAEEEIDTSFLDDPVTIRLVHADDGRLDEMVITTESHDGDERTVDRSTVRFSGWGQPVQIAAPWRGEVDVTPGVDEEDLAAFRAFPLLAPKSPPAGMELESAYVMEEDPEVESCASVDLAYGTESPPEADAEVAPFLRLSLVDRSCPSSDEEGAFFGSAVPAETVRVGPYEAQLRRLPAPPRDAGPPLLDIRLATDRVIVDAQTNLPQDQAVAALASLGPLDLASQPVARSEPPPG